MNELYRLLDLAEEECSAGEIGGMISHSKEYEKYLAKIETALLKLKEYKRVEEELGIDLLTLFKALKQGYVYKRLGTFGPIYKYNQFRIVSTHDGKIDLWAQVRLDPKKYGKRETEGWALTKEELE